jgi:hypothetical protein
MKLMNFIHNDLLDILLEKEHFMYLYLIHCGFYHSVMFGGFYENHVNFFVMAESFEEAKEKAKKNPEFQTNKMHIDGIQEIKVVDGYKINPVKESSLDQETVIQSYKYRELAPKV